MGQLPERKDVFEATLNYFPLALVDKQGQMMTGYDYSSLTDNVKEFSDTTALVE